MARHFARLKVRLLVNGLLRNRSRLPIVIIAALVPIPFVALATGIMYRAHLEATPAAHPTVICTVMFVAWIIVPLLGYGNDDTLDPTVFALFPLRPAQLLRGMLAAALVGSASFASITVVSGAVVGFADSFVTVLVGVALAATLVLLCVSVSRSITVALGALLASRRGRDVAMITTVALVVGLQLANVQLQNNIDSGALESFDRWLRWTPPGSLAHGFAALTAREWPVVMAAIGYNSIIIAIALWSWNRSLARTVDRPAIAQSPTATTSGSRGLFTGFPFLPHNRTGAVAARELRSFRRDPKRAVMLIPAVAVPIVWAFSLRPSGTSLAPTAPLLALSAIVFTNRFSANVFGVDGSAYWSHVVIGTDPYPDFVGKQMAISVLVTPMVVLMALGLGAVFATMPVALLTIALIPVVLGLHLGVGALSSVRFPQALPERGNPFGTLNGQGCASGLSAALMLGAELLAMLPIGIGLAVAAKYAPVAIPFVIGFGYAVAYATWRAATRRAARFLAPRLPELLALIDPKQA